MRLLICQSVAMRVEHCRKTYNYVDPLPISGMICPVNCLKSKAAWAYLFVLDRLLLAQSSRLDPIRIACGRFIRMQARMDRGSLFFASIDAE
jgi:hypothetical protein